MNVNDFLTSLAQILFVILSTIAIFDYVSRPNPRRRDFALLSSALGLPLGISFLRNAFGIELGLLDLLGAFALFSHPYFLFRLLQYYRPSRPWMHGAILLGMVLCWVILFVFIRPYPATTQVTIFGYCVIVDAYCTWGYRRGVRNTVGTLRRRLFFITVSSGLFTLAVASAVASALLPNLAQNFRAVGYAIAAVSAVLYYVAFIPPRWLRHAWQFEELHNYLNRIKFTGDGDISSTEHLHQLCSAVNQAVLGMAGAIVQWDEAAGQWTILGTTTPTFGSSVLQNGQHLIEQVWQQRQSVAIYVPHVQEVDERRPLEAVGARAWLLVPILTPERIWGVLLVILRDRSLFIDDDLTLLELFAQQYAIVLENNRLIDRLQGYSEQLEQQVEQRTSALSESEARFRNLADSVPAMIWMTNADGDILYLNQQWYDFLGLPSVTGTEIPWLDVVHPEDAQNAAQEFTQGHQQRTLIRHEYRLRRHDGVYRWLLDSAIPRLDQNGEFMGYIGSILDITERKEAEERLQVIYQLSEAVNRAEAVEQIYELALSELERVLYVTRASIMIADQERVMRFQAWRGLSATYREQVDGQSPRTIDEANPLPVFIPDVTKADLGDQQQVILDEGIQAIGFIPLVEHNHLLGKFILYYSQPHTFSEAEVQWAQTIARHVAHALDRMQAEAKLQTYTHTIEELNHVQLSLAAEPDLQKLLQMVTDVSTELSDAQFGAFFYNVAGIGIGENLRENLTDNIEGNTEDVTGNGTGTYKLYTLSGAPREAFADFPMPRATALFEPTFKGEGNIRLADVTQDPRYGQSSPYFGTPPGHLPICSYLAVPVVSRENEVIGGLFFGHSHPGVFTEQVEQLVSGIASQAAITIENVLLYAQLKESEIVLRELNATLEQRVETRTAELQRSNHELDQFAYVASHDLKAPLRAIKHLSTWIAEDARDVLPAPSQEHLIKLQGRVQRMETLLDDLLAYSRAGRQRHPAEEVDTAQLVADVIELIAPPAGFSVKISGKLPVLRGERSPLDTVFRNLLGNASKHHHRPTEGSVEISAQEQERFVEFTVKDDGPGIDPSFHQRIFEMFQTLLPRDQVEGSGVGLAVVKKSIESRGGTIQVESNLGEGTTFRFTWPKTVIPYVADS